MRRYPRHPDRPEFHKRTTEIKALCEAVQDTAFEATGSFPKPTLCSSTPYVNAFATICPEAKSLVVTSVFQDKSTYKTKFMNIDTTSEAAIDCCLAKFVLSAFEGGHSEKVKQIRELKAQLQKFNM
jgi:hypothetical protein